MWRVVDLGTKYGGAIGAFIKGAPGWFGDNRPVSKTKCLGVDRNPRHRSVCEAAGYWFVLEDVLTDFVWPEAEYYLAMNFLEHMPDVATSNRVFSRMMDRAARGVWLVMPSMETEPRLEELNLEFCWKNWSHHRSFYCRHHAQDAFDAQKDKPGGMTRIRFSPIKPMSDTSNPDLVPIRRPEGFTEKYEPGEMGVKPRVRLDPPIATGWNVIVTK